MNPAHNWCVFVDDGHFYVEDNMQQLIAEFETEQECWNYINKCIEHGVDF